MGLGKVREVVKLGKVGWEKKVGGVGKVGGIGEGGEVVEVYY